MDTPTTSSSAARAVSIRAAAAQPDGALIQVSGLITGLRPARTHHQDPWATFTLLEQVGQGAGIDVCVFPLLYPTVADLLTGPAVTVTITGRLCRPADKITAVIYAQQVTFPGLLA